MQAHFFMFIQEAERYLADIQLAFCGLRVSDEVSLTNPISSIMA